MSYGTGSYRSVTITELYVRGSGPFPLDMLRYDSCWPATEQDALAAERDTRSARVICLRRLVVDAGHRIPTVGRWQSFGWRVLDSYEVEAHKVGKVLA